MRSAAHLVTLQPVETVEELLARCEMRLGRYLAQLVRDRELAAYPLQDTFHDALRCGRRLGRSIPTTISSQKRGPHSPTFTFGVAQDGIVAASFRGGGKERTVPVHRNVWFYVGDSAALRRLTVHRKDGTKDGTSETLVYGRPQ